MKKGIVVAILAGAIVLGPTPASALSLGELLGRIRELLTQVQTLEKQVEEAQTTQNASTATKATKVSPANGNSSISSSNSKDGFCYNWEKNLRVGDRNSDVENLHRALEKLGYGPFERGDHEVSMFNEFREQTASEVVGFQEKYASEILTPNGLTRGNGYVGASTRAVLNRLFACGAQSFEIPLITALAPLSAKIGDVVTIYGSGFSSKAQNYVDLTLGNGTVTVDGTYVNGSMLTFKVPNTAYGNYHVSVNNDEFGFSEATKTLTISNTASQSSIKVLSPNGGEVLEMGRPYTFTWNTSGNVGPVDIQIFDVHEGRSSALQSVTIATGVPNTGSYTATIPSRFTLFSNESRFGFPNFKVRLYANCNSCPNTEANERVVDTSDNVFILKGYSLTSQPSIKVLSPNGGETFTAGDIRNIRWNTENFGSLGVSIDLLDKHDNIIKRIATNARNTGSYSWGIPKDIVQTGTTGAFKIAINSYDKGPSASDLSDSSFTIIPFGSQSSIAASLLNSYDDRAGAWDVFKPGKGFGNSTTKDWNWRATINVPGTKIIKSMYITHANGSEGWSTSADESPWGKKPYPLVVFQGGTQMIGGYDKLWFSSITDSVTFDLYGQMESSTWSGGKLVVTFTDGTSMSAEIPASRIPPVNQSQSITVLSPNGGEVYTVDQPIVVGFMNSDGKRTFFNLVDSKNAGFDLISYNNYYHKNVSDPYYPTTGGGLYDSTVRLYVPKDWIRDHGTQYKIEVCSENKCDKSDTYFTITSTYPTSTPTPTPTATFKNSSTVASHNIIIEKADQTLAGQDIIVEGSPTTIGSMEFAVYLNGAYTTSKIVEELTNLVLVDERGRIVAGPVRGEVIAGRYPIRFLNTSISLPVGKTTLILKGKLGRDLVQYSNVSFRLVGVSLGSTGHTIVSRFSEEFTTMTIRATEIPTPIWTPTPTPTPPATPSVTLLSPNGGQTLKKGETITVTWSSRNMTSAESIYLDIFKGNPQTGSSRVYRSALTTNDGQETLTIPTTLTAGADYYIHVTAAKGYFDASDSQIFITDSTGQFGLIPASKAYLSAAFETSSEDRAGAWDAFSGGRARLHSGSADWKWAITLDLLAQKTIQSITVLHKNENGEVWSTSANAGLTGVKPYPLVVLRGASQVNSAYDQTLGTFNTGSYTFTLYGQKESEITGTVKISVKFTDNTSVTKEVAAPTTTTTPTPTATPTLTPTPTPTPTPTR